MSQRALVCLSVLGIVIAAGCRTTVQLADPHLTAPASGTGAGRRDGFRPAELPFRSSLVSRLG